LYNIRFLDGYRSKFIIGGGAEGETL